MSNRFSSQVLAVITAAWLSAQIGQFFQARLPWGSNPLFWPLWICIVLLITVSLLLFDEWYKHRP